MSERIHRSLVRGDGPSSSCSSPSSYPFHPDFVSAAKEVTVARARGGRGGGGCHRGRRRRVEPSSVPWAPTGCLWLVVYMYRPDGKTTTPTLGINLCASGRRACNKLARVYTNSYFFRAFYWCFCLSLYVEAYMLMIVICYTCSLYLNHCILLASSMLDAWFIPVRYNINK